MKLSDVVTINEYFRRSININSDHGHRHFLEGYICPKSSEEAIAGLIKHIEGTGQCSFTWTGPYGAGKSSLVVLLSSLLSSDSTLRDLALSRLSSESEKKVKEYFDSDEGYWRILPVIGESSQPFRILSKAIVQQGFSQNEPIDNQELMSQIKAVSDESAGVVIFIDEMGKFLESFSNGRADTDIYLFQQLAELANSSQGKIILIGVLHQSFNEYSRHLPRIARDEWTKIQGRFIDYHINTAGEEQLELISRAICSEKKPKRVSSESKKVAEAIKKNRPISEDSFSKTLNACWPLHPVVAALLGPISRRRFGQNQRSIFSFLNSAEPSGFKEFIKSAPMGKHAYYYPDHYWDYIQLNLESSIIASSDSKLWALANDSLAKCDASGGSEDHIRLLKMIAVIDIFKGRSGLVASTSILETCGLSNKLDRLLNDLIKWSLLRYKKHSDAYSIFEGSDFDIETALDEAMGKIDTVNFMKLSDIASFKPFVAKRHYHCTGALRWMDVHIVPADRSQELINKAERSSNALGGFFVIVPTNIDEYDQVINQLTGSSNLFKKTSEYLVICGVSKKYQTILSYSEELLALEWIENNRHEMLAGDSVARREVESRKSMVMSLLEDLLIKQINAVSWVKDGVEIGPLSYKGITTLVSDAADLIFEKSPIVKSEMLNRDRPSSNANAALYALLRAVILNGGDDRLGIKGYPPEGGLFQTLLEDSELYIQVNEKWVLCEPQKNHHLRFNCLWKEADRILSNHQESISLSNIYEAWAKPPFGIKSGLLSFFSAIYLLTRNDKIALYLNKTYRPDFDDLFLDYLLKTPQAISLRWVNYDALTLNFLHTVKQSIRSVGSTTITIDQDASAFDIARSLVSLVDNLNPWVHRTRKLSKQTIRFRELVKAAHDPNKLLFDDIPSLLGIDSKKMNDDKKVKDVTNNITNALIELMDVYPRLINELGSLLLQELQVGIASKSNLERLKERAASIQGATGDFRVDALAARLSMFNQTHDDIAGIASLAANKPIKDWIDLDVDRAKQEIVSLCTGFKKAELLVRVQGRKSNRHALAMITALSGNEEIYELEFDLLDDETALITELKERLHRHVSDEAIDIRTALAAIAELGVDYIKKIKSQSVEKNNGQPTNVG